MEDNKMKLKKFGWQKMGLYAEYYYFPFRYERNTLIPKTKR